MTNSNSIKIYDWIVIIALVGLLIFFFKDCRGFMAPAPAGIHGTFSSSSYNPTYKAPVYKDSLLKAIAASQIIVRSGRLHSYDPPWDSLSYLLSNIPCDTGHVEAYIEFSNKKESQSTFRVLSFNASPIKDDEDYDRLTKHYYNCFETVLENYHVIKLSDTLAGNR
jgi:hypothetical protein